MSRVEESACDACLRRAFLVGRLAPRIAGLLDRPGRRTSGLLALSESDLLAAVAGARAEQIALDLEHFAPDAERERLARARVLALCRHGYRFADVWLVDGAEVEPYSADFCAAVHVRGDGYSLLPVEAGEREHKDLLYAQRIGQFMARSRDLVGPPIVPPTTSTFRLVRETS